MAMNPLILGSEGAGTVEAVGEAVTHVKKGDRVAYKSLLVSTHRGQVDSSGARMLSILSHRENIPFVSRRVSQSMSLPLQSLADLPR
jgi:NADPH:quinone reductase-like Zn-dependent oxidoreductase